MRIDALIANIRSRQNPCIMGIDPEWSLLPPCFRHGHANPSEVVLHWGMELIDAAADIVPAIKPQMAFFEVWGAEGIRIHQQLVQYAHRRGLLVVDDSKRGDIGNTARAYAWAHLSRSGPVNADFLTVSPFLGTDSMQPFIDTARQEGKGLFILAKTSNPGSAEISEAVTGSGVKIRSALANFIRTSGEGCMGEQGYSSIGAVVGATYPLEARELRQAMPHSFFLVPGFGAQGGNAQDAVACFNPDGLGALVSSSRGILYHYLKEANPAPSCQEYLDSVRARLQLMRHSMLHALDEAIPGDG